MHHVILFGQHSKASEVSIQ